MNYNQFEYLQNDKYFFELIFQQKIECKNLRFDVQDIFGNQQIQKDQIKFQIEDERTESNKFKVSFEKHQGIFLVQFTKPSKINDSSIKFSSRNLEQQNNLCPIEIIQINIKKQLYLLIGVGEGYINVIKYIEKKQKDFDDIDQIQQIIIKYLQILFQMSCDTFLEYQTNQQPQYVDIDNKDADFDDRYLQNVEENIRQYDDDKEKLVIYIQNISQLVTGFGKFKGMQIYEKLEQKNEEQKNEEQKNEEQKNEDYAMVGVLGNINKGKTFVINKLSRSEENLSREGELQRTHGITITQQTINNKTFFFADIEGNQQAYNMNLKQINKIFSNETQKENIPYMYSKLQENCINQFMIEHCNALIFITNSLSDDEQNAIEELKNYLKKRNTESQYLKQVIVIRNLKHKKNLKSLQKTINEECKQFNLQLNTNNEGQQNGEQRDKSCQYIEQIDNFFIQYYYLGDHESCQEIKDYNMMVFQSIKDNIQLTQYKKHNTDIISNVKKFMKKFILNYFLIQSDKQIDLEVKTVQNGLKVLTLNKKEGQINFLVNQRAIAESKFGFISSNLIYTIKESQLQNNSKTLVAEIEFPGFKKEELINSLNIIQRSSSIIIKSNQYEQSRINQSQNQHERFSQNAQNLNHQQYPQIQIKKQMSYQQLSEQYLTNTIKQDINELLVDDKDVDGEAQTDQHQSPIEQESLETIKQKKLQSFLIQIPIQSELDEHKNRRNIDYDAMDIQFQNVDRIISLNNGIIIFKFEIKYEPINQ
ncbi:hypothetical protein ABPG74_014111 [Tetrahymena malaccensis]